ncbi:lipoprotein [Deinobacterium chartae]
MKRTLVALLVLLGLTACSTSFTPSPPASTWDQGVWDTAIWQ